MRTRDQAVLMIAGRVQETCAEKVLEWGDAIRRSQAAPEDKVLLEKAREACRAVGELAVALSAGLGRKL